MQIIWSKGRVLVSDILDDLGELRPPHSTISSIVRILEKKGFVGHKAYGRTYEYFALLPKEEYSKHTVSRPVKAWKYALVLPIMLFLGVLFDYKSDVLPAGYPVSLDDELVYWSDTIHTQVDEMPVFPGCAHLTNPQERSTCSMQKLMEYLSKNVQYPPGCQRKQCSR